ncbi:MAG: ATP-binding cassette domain-containing protein [Candidatus Bipolaricaulia bacterium]
MVESTMPNIDPTGFVNSNNHRRRPVTGRPVAIRVAGLHKSFETVQALDGVDLVVHQGTVLALLGPNGAGKTTLVRILTTLLAPDAGQAQVAGYDIVRDAAALRSVIGLTGQYASVDENLTGRENLEMVGRLYHLGRAEARRRADELLKCFELTDAAHRLVKTYSGGMRRRLDLGASLVARPQVLFLDEPTIGLDPRGRIGLWEIIKELVSDGTTLLLTTQYLEEADHLADKIAVIDTGRIIAQGTADELKSQVGGEVLELHVSDQTMIETAVDRITTLGVAVSQIDSESGQITIPVTDGTSVLTEVMRRFDAAGITLSDLALRRPTLDDVFLTLTGHTTETLPEEPYTVADRRRGRRNRGGAL